GAPSHRLRARYRGRIGGERRGVVRHRLARGHRRGVVHRARVRCAGRTAVPPAGDGEAPPPRAVRALPARDLAAVHDAHLMAGPLPNGDPAPADGRLPGDLDLDPATPFSAYLHVPFCRVRCGYCDFNTYTSSELRGARQDEYADTLIREITLARDVLGEAGAVRPLDTVFFGGGTPTLLPAGDLGRMLRAASDAFGIRDDAEVTVEANPDTVTVEVVETLREAGVNRLSIGMQSAVPHVLAALDRTHRPENVGTAVRAAREGGLDVSVDLIYGAPGESLTDWERSLDEAISLQPDHISAYALI